MVGRVLFCLPCLAIAAVVTAKESALRFSKPSHRVMVPTCDALDIRDELTIEAWVFAEPGTRQRNRSFIVSKNYADTGYGLETHGIEGNVLEGQGGRSIEGVPTGKWTHVALSRSTRAFRLFIDGKLVSLVATAGPMKPNKLKLWIGSSPFLSLPGNQPTTWIGRIQEVRIWGVARSEKQIRESMNRHLRGSEPGLRAYYPLNEGKGQVIRDVTGHAAAGYLGDSAQQEASDPEWAEGLRLRPAVPTVR
jgi:hypothetical protein